MVDFRPVLKLVTEEHGEIQTSVFHPEILPDIGLIARLIHVEETRHLTSRPLAWEISIRVLRVQFWARYYGLTPRALTALATGMHVSTRR